MHKSIYLDKHLKSGYYVEVVDMQEKGYKVVLKLLKKNTPQKGAIIYKQFKTMMFAERYYNQIISIVEENSEALQSQQQMWKFKTHILKFLMTHRN